MIADRVVVGAPATRAGCAATASCGCRAPASPATSTSPAPSSRARPATRSTSPAWPSAAACSPAGTRGCRTSPSPRPAGCCSSGARIGGDLVFSGARIERSDDPPDPPEDAAEGSRTPVLPGGIVDAGGVPGRRPRARRGQPGARRRAAHHRHGPAAQRVRSAVPAAVGCAAVGPQGSERGSRCSPTAWRWAATSRAATTAAARSPAPGRCGWSTRTCAARASLSGVTLAAPDGYALLADRLRVGGELYLRRLRCAGHDPAAERRGRRHARLHRRPRWTARGCARTARVRPSLDAPRGHDRQGPAVPSTGSPRPAGCGVRRDGGAQVGPVRRRDAVGTSDAGYARYALNAYGLVTTDLVAPSRPSRPAGRRAAGAGAGRHVQPTPRSSGPPSAGSTSTGFDYDQLMHDTREIDLRTRLRVARAGRCPTTPRAPTSSSRPPTGGPARHGPAGGAAGTAGEPGSSSPCWRGPPGGRQARPAGSARPPPAPPVARRRAVRRASRAPISRRPSRSATSPATAGTRVTGTAGVRAGEPGEQPVLPCGAVDPVGVQAQHGGGERGAAQLVRGVAGPASPTAARAPGGCG